MSATAIKWTRESDGVYVTADGLYEVVRTLDDNARIAWVAYYVGTKNGDQFDKRLTSKQGVFTVATAKRMCDTHRKEVEA